MNNKRGFTLIELLVVVAIIGILSGIAFVSISGARESAYDTQIKSELSQVRSSAEMHYYDQGGTYGGGNVGSQYQAYDDSSGWERLAEELPPCSADVHSRPEVDYTNPNQYQIDVDNQRYLAWAALCTEADEAGNPHWYCIDSSGNALETMTDPADHEGSFTCPDE